MTPRQARTFRSAGIPFLPILWAALLLGSPAPPARALVVEDWSGVIPWFSFTFKRSDRTGRFMDANGSRITFGNGKTPLGERAIKLSSKIVPGGFAGVWNCLDSTVDIRGYDYFHFVTKAKVPGPVRIAVKDDRNVTYVTSFTVASTEWTEVNLPLTLFVKDRYASPANPFARFEENERFDEKSTSNLDPYEQSLKAGVTAQSPPKKKTPVFDLLSDESLPGEDPDAGLQDIDTRSLASAEVLCGPGQEKWGPETRIDSSRIRMFCLSPLTTGKNQVLVGPIEALKWGKKPAAKPTAVPTAAPTPTASNPDVMDMLEPPANFYVRFTGPAVYQLELLDRAGVHYRTLFRQRVTAQDETWVQWDGLSEQNTPALPGSYTVELTKDGVLVKRIQLILHPRNPLGGPR